MNSNTIVYQVLRSYPELKKLANALPVEAALKKAIQLAIEGPDEVADAPYEMLRILREEEGISQRELAALTGMSQGNLSAIESGNRPLGPKIARRLAKTLGVDFRELL